MADSKITDLAALTTPDDADVLPVVDVSPTPTTKKITRGNLLAGDQGTKEVAFACGTSGTITIHASYKTLAYTKIGRQVTVTGYLHVASVSSPVGALLLTGLPYVCASGDAYNGSVSVRAHNLAATALTMIQGYVSPGTSYIVLDKFSAGQASALAGDIQANSNFMICATYFV